METRKKKKPEDQKKLSGRSLSFRSRITNGKTFLPFVDLRSEYPRRLRDLIKAYEADLGGREVLSEGQKALARRAALLQTELEFAELRLAKLREEGTEPNKGRIESYQRCSNTLRRLIESLGLNEGRKQRDITPEPDRTHDVIEHIREVVA